LLPFVATIETVTPLGAGGPGEVGVSDEPPPPPLHPDAETVAASTDTMIDVNRMIACLPKKGGRSSVSKLDTTC
jgi:hypothetical protein